MCILRAYLTGGDVAAPDQSRQLGRRGRPKNGLRSHQGDVSETSPDKVTTMIRPEVAGTSPRRLRQSPWSPARRRGQI